MKLILKTIGIAVFLGILFLLTFVWWGTALETCFSHEACARWFEQMRATGWAFGIVLLISDLFLPIPATGVMSALGHVYGFWGGWFFGAIGSTCAGLLGYGLTRICREEIAHRLANPQDLRKFQALFDHWGGGAIIISRILPILPEVMAVLAGLAKMHFAHFFMALLLGTVPVSGLFSWFGHVGGATAPATTHVIATVLPLLLWPVVLILLRWHVHHDAP